MYIAIDPSYDKNLAIAWLDDNNKLGYKSIVLDPEDRDPETRDLQHIALKVYKIIEILSPKKGVLAIEGQFVKFNANVALQLVELRSLIQGMVLINFPNLKIVTISPRTWQADILKAGRLKSAEIKKKSIEYATDLVKQAVSEDEADAICILKYIEKYNGKKNI